jgi:nuclear-control-of-ATPase protein 2
MTKKFYRRIERLLNLASDSNILDCESQGILLCEVHLLRSYACYLPTRNAIRDLFIEDLRDIENPRLTIKQKLETIERMTRSWSFLRP